MSGTSLHDYARIAAERFRRGRVVPFIGAGVNLADRSPGAAWRPGVDLPSGGELAEQLATKYPYPATEPQTDLMRVSQYVDVQVGETAIYDDFHELFAGTFRPTIVHHVLAQVPGILRTKGIPQPHLLIATTNYDDALEQAFAAAGEEYDLVWYMARGDNRGRFIHQAPGQPPAPVDEPARSSLSIGRRNVILKIHGAAYRPDDTFDSYVVTEDHYIEYMHGTDLVSAVPVKLKTTMLDSHFLFLGYRLGDWNLRVFLHGLWAARDKSARNWAVDRSHRPLDTLFWEKRGVEMIESPLVDYVTALRAALQSL